MVGSRVVGWYNLPRTRAFYVSDRDGDGEEEADLDAAVEDCTDEAIVIHKVDTTREDRLAQVVDVDNNGDPNDDGAMWTVGEVFTDRDNMLQVSIDAAYAGGYRVTINTDPTTFSACIEAGTLGFRSHSIQLPLDVDINVNASYMC